MYMRLAIRSSGGPTRPSAPAIPGIVWQEEQPNLGIAVLPRDGSPPVHRFACSRASRPQPIVTAARNRSAPSARIRGRWTLPLTDIARARIELLGSRVNDAALRFTQPRGKEGETDDDENRSEGNPHQKSGELLVRERVDVDEQRAIAIDRIPGPRSQRQKRAENGRVDAGGEDVEHRDPVAQPPISA